MVQGWQREISRAIVQSIQEGHLRKDTDVSDLVFGIYGVILVLHHDARLMKSAEALPRAHRAIDRLLQQFTRVPLPRAESLQHHQAA